jgi:hypothetical protein
LVCAYFMGQAQSIVNSAMQTADEATSVTSPATTAVSTTAGPVIGSFTASPNPVAPGGSETLTAANVTAGSSNGTVTQVAFYLDSNGDGVLEPGIDILLGHGTQIGPGVWAGTANAPADTPIGTYQLFAQRCHARGGVGLAGSPRRAGRTPGHPFPVCGPTPTKEKAMWPFSGRKPPGGGERPARCK